MLSPSHKVGGSSGPLMVRAKSRPKSGYDKEQVIIDHSDLEVQGNKKEPMCLEFYATDFACLINPFRMFCKPSLPSLLKQMFGWLECSEEVCEVCDPIERVLLLRESKRSLFKWHQDLREYPVNIRVGQCMRHK